MNAAGIDSEQAVADLWALWGRLVRPFSTWRLMGASMLSWVGWGVYGADFISALRRGRYFRPAFDLLAGASDRQLEGLAGLAAANAVRNEHMFRIVALLYVTIPVTLILATAEIAPDVVVAWVRRMDQWLLLAFVGFSLMMLYYLGALWRARQIVTVLEIVRVERGLTRPG